MTDLFVVVEEEWSKIYMDMIVPLFDWMAAQYRVVISIESRTCPGTVVMLFWYPKKVHLYNFWCSNFFSHPLNGQKLVKNNFWFCKFNIFILFSTFFFTSVQTIVDHQLDGSRNVFVTYLWHTCSSTGN